MKFQSALIHIIALGIFLSSGFIFNANAQNQDYRKVSLSIHGGATLENGADGFNLLDSRFNVVTETSANLGAGIQYAITPAWSLQGGYSYTKIRGVSQSFETSLNTLSLKNIFNLNQILFVNRISNSINPYLTAGVGYDFYEYESPSETVDDNSLSYNLGAGLAFKISPTFDLFTHYEYQIASNRIDNIYATQNSTVGNGFGADVLVNLTGGIRINFGKKGTTHPSWRPVPVDVNPNEYKRLVSQDKRAEELKQELADLEDQLEEQDRNHRKQINAHTEQIDNLKQQVNNLKVQLKEARDSLNTALQNQKEYESKIDESISAGHYVQIFASLDLQSAQNVHLKATSTLKELLDNPEQQIFIASRMQFYEVLIGTFNDNLQKANEVLEVMEENYEDAFIITFPRPSNIQNLYKGIKKVK